MSRSEDTGRPAEPIASETELLLVDLLYGELEGDEAAAAREKVEADESLRAELAALEALRGVWGRLDDEEPPASVTSKLVHAASAGGPRAAVPATGLWAAIKRWFQIGRAHPGVYAFATLILVAGVAGALYVAGGSDADERLARSEAPAPGGGEATAVTTPDEPAAPMEEMAPAAPEPEPAEPVAEGEQARDEGGATSTTGRAAPGASAVREQDKMADRPRSNRGPSARRSKSKPADDPAPASGRGSVGGSTSKDSEVRQKKSSGAKGKAPAAPSTRAYGGDVLDIDTTDVPLKEEKPAPPERERATADEADEDRSDGESRVRELHRQATAAAKRSDCAEALRLGEQIRKLDGRYYDTDFLADPLIRECRKKAPNGY